MQAAADALWGRISVQGMLPVDLDSKCLRGHGISKKKRNAGWGHHLQLDFPKAWGILDSAIKNNVFPGAQVLIAKDGNVVFSGGFGHHTYARGSPHVTTESIYDIASITKVVSITPIVMKLISRKQLRLDQPIYHFIPDFKGGGKENITIRHLLTHSSGIKSYHRFFLEEKYSGRKDVLNEIIKMDLEFSPGSQFSYTD
jgi:CubicO group peptidase (beta-lactamase class C family)